MLSPEGKVVARLLREAFAALGELAKRSPGEADAIAQQIVGHLRSSQPTAFQLDTQPLLRVEP
jgi:hypothetical protein